ncbi:hypothetical protein JCM10213_007475 [Rhodosporidiobolus nylandii]
MAPTLEEVQKQLDEANAKLAEQAATQAQQTDASKALGEAMGAAIGAKLAANLNPHAPHSGGGRQVGLSVKGQETPAAVGTVSVSNGVGDVPVRQDLVRLMRAGVFVPLSLMDDQVLTSLATHSISFLQQGYTPKDLSAAKKALEPYWELDHLLPHQNLLAAITKFSHLVAAVVARDSKTGAVIKTDFAKLLYDLAGRANGAGMDRVVREYYLLRAEDWRANLECENAVPFDKNLISTFKPLLWQAAIVAAGARSEHDLLRKDQTSGTAATPFGAATKLVGGGQPNATLLTKLRTIVQEDKKIGADVIMGLQPEGAVPASLNYRSSLAGPIRSNGNGGNGGGGGGGGKASRKTPYGQEDVKPVIANAGGGGGGNAGGGNTGGGNANANAAGQPFQWTCNVCDQPGHFMDKCPHLDPAVTVRGRDLIFTLENGETKSACRRSLQNRCVVPNCHNAHGCPLCNTIGHHPRECPKRAEKGLV